MASPLIFPDGANLAAFGDLPGPAPSKAEAWARIQSANIAPGFVFTATPDELFAFYSEANVNAPDIWAVFQALCDALLLSQGTLLLGQIDGEPHELGFADVRTLSAVLSEHAHQLAHDAFIQFGIVCQTEDEVLEVFVAPTKHFKIWGGDEEAFRRVMANFALSQQERLEFLDEYPRTSVTLPSSLSFEELKRRIENALSLSSSS